MTCILGLKRDGKVYMGSDSRYLDGWHIHRSPNPKIFRVGNMLIGTSGSNRVSDILQYNLIVEEEDMWPDNPAEYVAREVIPEMQACLKEHDGMEGMKDSAIMVAYQGCLFIIGEDFSLSEIESYEAIGAGAKYALGYIYAMHKTAFLPRELIEKALECAAYFSASCAGPWVVDHI
jgi:ATP-dependent protease HslVU (ClpYQ) peptidase subunit